MRSACVHKYRNISVAGLEIRALSWSSRTPAGWRHGISRHWQGCTVGGVGVWWGVWRQLWSQPAEGQQLVSPEGVLIRGVLLGSVLCWYISHGRSTITAFRLIVKSSVHTSPPLRPYFLQTEIILPNFSRGKETLHIPVSFWIRQVISSRTTCFPQGIFLSALCQPLFKWIFMGVRSRRPQAASELSGFSVPRWDLY